MKKNITPYCIPISPRVARRHPLPGLFKILFAIALLGNSRPATAQTTNAAPYCQYNSNMTVNGLSGAISKVSLGTLNNATAFGNQPTAYTSTGCPQLYTYYNNVAAPTITAGANATISLEFKSRYDGEPLWYAAYIDFNHNNVFDTTAEMIIDMAHANVLGFLPTSTTPTVITTTRTNTFTVPANAVTGTTRMRVIRSHRDYLWNDSVSRVNPCMSYPYINTSSSNWYFGEVEDYDVTIAAPSAPTPLITAITASPVTQNTAKLNAVVNANGTAATISFEYGVTAAYGNSVAATPSSVTGTAATPVTTAVIAGFFPNNTYHYRVKAVAGGVAYYSADSVFKTLPTTAVGNTLTEEEISIFPNPTTGHINIDLHGTKSEVTIEVMNITGNIVFSGKEQVNGTKSINLANLPGGLYNVLIRSGAKQYRTNICIVR